MYHMSVNTSIIKGQDLKDSLASIIHHQETTQVAQQCFGINNYVATRSRDKYLDTSPYFF